MALGAYQKLETLTCYTKYSVTSLSGFKEEKWQEWTFPLKMKSGRR